MILTRINIVLGILLVVAVACAMAMDADHSLPNVEFLPEMKVTATLNAYEPNDAFRNGRTLQNPVEGTIARGETPLYYTATRQDAVRAGDELNNPIQAEELGTAEAALRLDASVQRGAETYRVFCIPCHGATGAGDGPVAKRGFPPPPPLTTGKSVQMKDGQLFHILTYGAGSMSSMTAQLDREQRWDAVSFVRSLQKSATSSPPPVAPAADGAGVSDSPRDGDKP